MKIKLLKSTNCDGKRVAAGDVVESTKKTANYLINIKFAVLYVERPKPKAKPQSNKAIDPSELEKR